MAKERTTKEEIGRRVREIRTALGLSRAQMAEKLRISVATLKNGENGFQRIGDRTLADAERLLAGVHPVAEIAARAEANAAEAAQAGGAVLPETEIAKVLRLSREPTVQSAATALSLAAGLSQDEALAAVIRVMLAQRN